MYGWVRPYKIEEDIVDRWFGGDWDECQKQLYLAVMRGEVRAMHGGKPLDLEKLRDYTQGRSGSGTPYTLPPDIQLNDEDVKSMCRRRRGH
jgi:hypothetical protein